MNGRKIYKLSDIADVQTGPFGSQLHQRDYVDVGTPCIMPCNIGANLDVKTDNIAHLKDADILRLNKYCVKVGDIIYSRRGDIEKCAYINQLQEGWLCGTGCLRIRPNTATCFPKYLAYLLSTKESKKWIVANAVGTTMLNLNSSILNTMPISLPPLAEQKRIADILSAIDDKIELNRRINANLEQQAQALYKSWFVDNNTNKIRLEEVVKTTSGGTPSRSHTEYYGGNYGWIKSKELNGSFISKTEESITDLAILKSSAKILPEMSVLIAMYGATVGQYAITSKPMTCNQAICALLPNENYPYTYLFMVAKNKKEELINNAVGSAQQNISQVIIKDLLISNDIAKIKEFHNKVAPIFGIIRKNTEENINLSTLRDTLLPKLMSGEIKV